MKLVNKKLFPHNFELDRIMKLGSAQQHISYFSKNLSEINREINDMIMIESVRVIKFGNNKKIHITD